MLSSLTKQLPMWGFAIGHAGHCLYDGARSIGSDASAPRSSEGYAGLVRLYQVKELLDRSQRLVSLDGESPLEILADLPVSSSSLSSSPGI
jgi:hypothetical protein